VASVLVMRAKKYSNKYCNNTELQC